MKKEHFNSKLGKVFDPKEPYIANGKVVLRRHPEEALEGATKGYVDAKLDYFYKNSDIKGPINDTEILKMKGPDIIHNQTGLWLRKLHPSATFGVEVDVDQFGRVTKVYPIKIGGKDAGDVKFDWGLVVNKPTTIDGYKITDLASRNKYETITGKTSVTYQNEATFSPVPYSHLKTLWNRSNYQLNVGDVVLKHKQPTNGKWIRAIGTKLTKAQYPELSNAVGKGKDSFKIVDMTEREAVLRSSYGIKALYWIKAKS